MVTWSLRHFLRVDTGKRLGEGLYHSTEAEKGFTSFLKSVSYEKGGQGPRIKKTLNLSQAAGKNEATLES